MDKQRFLHIIKNPHDVNQEDLNGLEELVKNFPFCNSAYILMAKGYYENGSMYANQKLKQAALYSTNRVLLKRIIEKKTFPDVNNYNLSESHQTVENHNKRDFEKQESINEDFNYQNLKNSSYAGISENDKENINNDRNKSHKVNTENKKLNSNQPSSSNSKNKNSNPNPSYYSEDKRTKKEQKDTKEDNPFILEYNSSMVFNESQISSKEELRRSVEENLKKYKALKENAHLDDYLTSNKEEKNEKEQELISNEQKISETSLNLNGSDNFFSNDSEKLNDEDKDELKEELDQVIEEYSKDAKTSNPFFSEKTGFRENDLSSKNLSDKEFTLNKNSDRNQKGLKFYVHNNINGKEIRKTNNDVISDYLKFRYSSNEGSSEKDDASLYDVSKDDISEQDQIIENFLANQPEINRSQELEEESKRGDLADLDYDSPEEEFISENFARIYFNQGKKDKAKKIYQKLMLKYPDKKAYFAEQIKLMEEK